MTGKFVSLIEESGVIKKHRSGTFIPSGDIDFYDEEHIEALIEEYKQINQDLSSHEKIFLKHRIACIREILDEYRREGVDILIRHCICAARAQFTDTRNSMLVKYPLDALIIVIILAKMCGYIIARDIVDFYRTHQLELKLLIPGLPQAKYRLSASTVNTVISLINPEQLKEFLVEYFSNVRVRIEEQIQYQKGDVHDKGIEVRDTQAFDGQELKASYQKGSDNRRLKGQHIVTLYNSTKRAVVDYQGTDKKNNERTSVLSMFTNTSISGKVVMSDALNSSGIVTDAILKAGADYLMPIKQNGNKELCSHMEGIFNRNSKQSLKTSSVYKDHGRIDEYYYEALSGELIDTRIKNSHKSLNTLVKYTHVSTPVINGNTKDCTSSVRYYVSSLPFADDVLNQIKASIEDYWYIETHHGILDNPKVFNQDAVESYNSSFLKNEAGFNKISLNILSYVRQIMSKELKVKRPISYDETMGRLNSDFSIILAFRYFTDYFFDEEYSKQ